MHVFLALKRLPPYGVTSFAWCIVPLAHGLLCILAIIYSAPVSSVTDTWTHTHTLNLTRWHSNTEALLLLFSLLYRPASHPRICLGFSGIQLRSFPLSERWSGSTRRCRVSSGRPHEFNYISASTHTCFDVFQGHNILYCWCLLRKGFVATPGCSQSGYALSGLGGSGGLKKGRILIKKKNAFLHKYCHCDVYVKTIRFFSLQSVDSDFVFFTFIVHFTN